jgi:peptidoglycan/xylan/chitin deacetylase (PgdA/CDA1 family)
MERQLTGRLTAIAYHYVRPSGDEAFPDLKGLCIEDFRGQLDYLRSYYHLIDPRLLIEYLAGSAPELPPRAALLTFDDGLADHYLYVLPILREYGLAGAFFPPVQAVVERKLLDVHKAHFILARVRDKGLVAEALCELVDDRCGEFNLESVETYRKRWATEGRYGDEPAVVFVKRMLQKGLPAVARSRFADELFSRFVSGDQRGFADELYLNSRQMGEMTDAGMYIGGHGYSHSWLDTLDREEQLSEVLAMRHFLGSFHSADAPWLLTYPHGSHNPALQSLLAEQGCIAAFTVEIGIAELDRDSPLALPRLDTNHLPRRLSEPVEWTRRVMQ